MVLMRVGCVSLYGRQRRTTGLVKSNGKFRSPEHWSGHRRHLVCISWPADRQFFFCHRLQLTLTYTLNLLIMYFSDFYKSSKRWVGYSKLCIDNPQRKSMLVLMREQQYEAEEHVRYLPRNSAILEHSMKCENESNTLDIVVQVCLGTVQMAWCVCVLLALTAKLKLLNMMCCLISMGFWTCVPWRLLPWECSKCGLMLGFS